MQAEDGVVNSGATPARATNCSIQMQAHARVHAKTSALPCTVRWTRAVRDPSSALLTPDVPVRWRQRSEVKFTAQLERTTGQRDDNAPGGCSAAWTAQQPDTPLSDSSVAQGSGVLCR
jgi:hypothetical protein